MESPREPLFRVVVNTEEQYSVWPAHNSNPEGWSDAGKEGKKDECLAWIEAAWVDMRPLSLRRAMDGIPPPPRD